MTSTYYILCIGSLVEYYCVVWHSFITEEECTDIERIQNTALRIILKENYLEYSTALQMAGLKSLENRTQLSLTFAKKCFKSDNNIDLFPLNVKTVNTRPNEKYYVPPARTERLAKSTVPYLQRLLNNQ